MNNSCPSACATAFAAVLLATSMVLPSVSARADTVDGLVEFSAGTSARASEVNGNFSEVATSVNDNDARIAALEAEIAELREQLGNVMSVNQFLSLEIVNDRPAIRITGANLQIVNGEGKTGSSNGTGNLLIGYDERRPEGSSPECSLGTNPDTGVAVLVEKYCLLAGGEWRVNHTGGSHYLVVGSQHNYSRWGGIIAGSNNTSNYDFASVSGGSGNRASGRYSSVGGGLGNSASARLSSVSGGSGNSASGYSSSISGGRSNTASAQYSSISGGGQNTASGDGSSISGGTFNSATSINSSITGGYDNSASGWYSSVSGGYGNTADGNYYSSISGGYRNTASGDGSSVSGGRNRSATENYAWAAGSLSEDE